MKRSAYWEEVTTLVERSREECASFDPAADESDPHVPLAAGVGPIIELYVDSRRESEPLSAVEESLLEGVLNDWLDQFAACHDTVPDDRVSLHEVAMCYADHGSLVSTGRDLVGLDAATSSSTPAASASASASSGGTGTDGGADTTGDQTTGRSRDREDREPVR
ncbi:hypothetical protein [Salinirubrum litoreum]|uniref:DUF8055 domain-containing protein n=1 Tax=Salinirubrum litoreum TaxID=1126234 RepID=A0ABD5R985_9EURY|nr:hypothetical protein [Salinirubrum litoreum]